MEKVRITRPEAYSKFKEEDFELMDEELNRLYQESKEAGKEQTMEFFYMKEKDLVILEIYWDLELVSEITYY